MKTNGDKRWEIIVVARDIFWKITESHQNADMMQQNPKADQKPGRCGALWTVAS